MSRESMDPSDPVTLSEGKPTRRRGFELNLLIRGRLQAHALTLPLLGNAHSMS